MYNVTRIRLAEIDVTLYIAWMHNSTQVRAVDIEVTLCTLPHPISPPTPGRHSATRRMWADLRKV